MVGSEPQIDRVERGLDQVIVRLTVHEHLACFEGHFTDCPLLPGVVQIEWAIELGQQHLGIAGGFRGMRGIKFMRLIQPGAKLELHLRYDLQRRELRFEYRDDDATCSAGTVLFGAVE